MRESGRGRKGPPDRRTLGPTGTLEQVESNKGGQPDRGRTAHARARNSFGKAAMGGKCRRVVEACRRGSCTGGRLLHDRARWGGKKRVKRELEEASTGERWGESMR